MRRIDPWQIGLSVMPEQPFGLIQIEIDSATLSFHGWFTSMSGFSSSMQTTNTQLSESYRAKLRDRFARGQFLSSIVSVARIADLAHECRLEYTNLISSY